MVPKRVRASGPVRTAEAAGLDTRSSHRVRNMQGIVIRVRIARLGTSAAISRLERSIVVIVIRVRGRGGRFVVNTFTVARGVLDDLRLHHASRLTVPHAILVPLLMPLEEVSTHKLFGALQTLEYLLWLI